MDLVGWREEGNMELIVDECFVELREKSVENRVVKNEVVER